MIPHGTADGANGPWRPGRRIRSLRPALAQRIHQVEGYIDAMHRTSLGGLTAEQEDKELCHVA